MKLKYIVQVIFLLLCSKSFGQEDSYKKFRISAHGGYGYRFAALPDNISEEEEKFINELRSGFSYELNVSYMYKEDRGIGLLYNAFSANAESALSTIQDDNGNNFVPNLSRIDKIRYIGPQFIYKIGSNDNLHWLTTNVSLGYLSYRQVVDQSIEDIKLVEYDLVGSSIGYQIGAGYEYTLSEWFSIGAKIDVLGGTIDGFEVENFDSIILELTDEDFFFSEELDQSEGLIRVNFMLGANFYF